MIRLVVLLVLTLASFQGVWAGPESHPRSKILYNRQNPNSFADVFPSQKYATKFFDFSENVVATILRQKEESKIDKLKIPGKRRKVKKGSSIHRMRLLSTWERLLFRMVSAQIIQIVSLE